VAGEVAGSCNCLTGSPLVRSVLPFVNQMMSHSKLSIVIVNWKTPILLARCLKSIEKDSGFSQFTIYVVDNNSQDQSVSLLETEFPHVRLQVNQENVGFSRACNQVIAKVDSEYVLLLNPDTEVGHDAVSNLVQFMDKHPECGAVGPKVLNPDGSLQLACRRSFPSPSAAFFRLTYLSRLFPKIALFSKYNLTYAAPDVCTEVDALSGACMMVRKKAVDQIGLLDEEIFMFGEDIDWCWRIKEANWKIFYLPDAVVWHAHGASSRLRPIGATIDLHKGMEVFYRKHLASKYWAPFNALVYAAIWMRAIVFVVINFVRAKAVVGVAAKSSKY
jgi:N-acetylglucosaminyl-diphospho-decaprenol L-rhamnosyltransferase